MTRLISWNVNGIRAIYKKGFLDWVSSESPDIMCIQETKAHKDQLQKKLADIEGYHSAFSEAERKGYSGVATYSKAEPAEISRDFGEHDKEGRVLVTKFDTFTLLNIYFPNGKASKARLEYKLDFYDDCLAYCRELATAGENVIICGDVNTAHTEKDIARPKENEKVSGFLPVERQWIDRLLASGYDDSFRLFNDEAGHYSWWDYKTRARQRNVGWRIDYFFTSTSLRGDISASYMLPDVMGSDHCPIVLEIDR